MSIEQNLENILAARYGEDVRQAIHDAIELGYNIASNAKATAETAHDSAAASATAANASKTAAQTAATNAQNYASQAEQYRNDAFHTTPAGYGEFVSEVNSSLDYLSQTGVCNVLPFPYKTGTTGIFTENSDGTVTINGTPTSDVNYRFQTERSDVLLQPKAGKYKFTIGNTTQGITRVIQAYNGTTFVRGILNDSSDAGTEFTIDYNGYDRLECYITIAANTSFNNVTIKPFLRPSFVASGFVPYAQSNAALTEKTFARAYEITAGENITINRHSLCKIGNVLIGTVSFKSSVANPTHILRFGSKPLNGRTDIPFYSIGNRALVGFLLADSSSFAIDKNEGSIEADTNYMFNVALIMSE